MRTHGQITAGTYPGRCYHAKEGYGRVGTQNQAAKEKYCRFYSLNCAECLKSHKPHNILLDFLLKIANR